MSRAHINLEDAGDGSFHARVVFVGGWDKDSHAHQYANILMKELNVKAQALEEPEIQTEEDPITTFGEGWVAKTPVLGS